MDKGREADQFKNLVADYADRALEVVLAADLLRQIPVIKTRFAAKDAVRSVRDEMLLKKLSASEPRFPTFPRLDRQRMVAKLESDPKYAHRVGLASTAAASRR